MATVRPTSDVSNIGWATVGSGASLAARLADSDDGTGIQLTYPSVGDFTCEVGDPPSIDTTQPVTLRIRATAGLTPASLQVTLTDGSGDPICAPTFSIAMDGFTMAEYTYPLTGGEKANFDSLSSIRARFHNVSHTTPGGDDWVTVALAELEYVESGGGGAPARRRLLPLLGVG